MFVLMQRHCVSVSLCDLHSVVNTCIVHINLAYSVRISSNPSTIKVKVKWFALLYYLFIEPSKFLASFHHNILFLTIVHLELIVLVSAGYRIIAEAYLI